MKVSINKNMVEFLEHAPNKNSGFQVGNMIGKKIYDILPGVVCYVYHVFEDGEAILHFSNATTILHPVLALRKDSSNADRQIYMLNQYMNDQGYTVKIPSIDHHAWNTPWTLPEAWIAALLVAIVTD